jgi:large subunit ribosomal protein L15
MGQTAGKGQKGQKSRSGDGIMIGFEGGQTPLVRRIPKRGFNHASKIHYEPIGLSTLQKEFENGSEINGKALFEKGLLKNAAVPFKILANGKCTKSLRIVAGRISKSAEKVIKDAGGSFTSK